MAKSSGASQVATGSITANTDSTLTLVHKSSAVMIINASAVLAYVRLNGAVSTSVYDFILYPGEEEWIEEIDVETVHVYMNATSGLVVRHW